MADTTPPTLRAKITKETSKDREIEEIVKQLVLPYLPAKSLFRFQCVSKKCLQRLNNPFLSHEQSYYFQDLSGFFYQKTSTSDPNFVSLNDVANGVPDPSLKFLPKLEELSLVNSCNGLLLCQSSHDTTYYICNPTTQLWRKLSKPNFFHGSESSALIAFNPHPLNVRANFKLICPVPLLDQSVTLFEIYTSQTESWTTSDAACQQELTLTSNRIYFNGVAYWETSSRSVLAFNVFYEVYEIIPLPDQAPPHAILTQIRGELCYIGITKGSGTDDDYCIMICSGMNLSLKREINVNIQEPGSNRYVTNCRVLPCLDGEEVMILKGCCIYSYRLREETIEVVRTVSLDDSVADKYLAFVNSLVHVASPVDKMRMM